MCIEIMKDTITNSSVTVHVHKNGEKSGSIEKQYRGTPSRPSCSRQQWMFRRLNWENKGVKFDRKLINNLRFDEDIIRVHRNTTRITTDTTRHGRRSVGDGGTRPPTFQLGGDHIGKVPPTFLLKKSKISCVFIFF